ncbi:MAG: hypothetical protein ACSHW7_14290 [Patiriisocius sp.]|uniref:hypothetical protein n=1 Tax=Patiriisocius sp. TaxID=2822396 RepID=UPI003EF26BED
MEKHRYKCHYCGAKYIPKRRHVQKYCSNSCRVNAFNLRKKGNQNLPKIRKEKKGKNKIAKEKMSLSGVGNAALGTLAVNLSTNLFTKEENKPATKGDIQKLLDRDLNKILLIKNMPPRFDGAIPYFDTLQQIIVYKV